MANQGFGVRTTEVRAVQKQHVELHRKVLLRRRLLRWSREGPVYVPFMGDGDIAQIVYRGRPIFGADLDPSRVEVARERFPHDRIVEADCDYWPFPGLETTFSFADIDAYADPYPAFRAFWQATTKTDPFVVVFTDGHYMAAQRTGWWHPPDGSDRVYLPLGPGSPRMKITWWYLAKYVWPWFDTFIEPYHVLDRWRYRRGHVMYWGAALSLSGGRLQTRPLSQKGRATPLYGKQIDPH